MKKLITITDEDLLKVIDSIYALTENRIVSREGSLGLSFEDSFRKYGSAHINIERISHDTITDGYYTVESKSKVVFRHNSIWFAELDCDGEAHRNGFVGVTCSPCFLCIVISDGRTLVFDWCLTEARQLCLFFEATLRCLCFVDFFRFHPKLACNDSPYGSLSSDALR